VHQDALVDDVRAAPNGLQRGCRRRDVRLLADDRNVTSVGQEPIEHGPLMGLAPLYEIGEPDVELMRRMEFSACSQQVQPGQVLTGQEVGHVARGQPQAPAGDLHEARSGSTP
jgi:hypothetical protein